MKKGTYFLAGCVFTGASLFAVARMSTGALAATDPKPTANSNSNGVTVTVTPGPTQTNSGTTTGDPTNTVVVQPTAQPPVQDDVTVQADMNNGASEAGNHGKHKGHAYGHQKHGDGVGNQVNNGQGDNNQGDESDQGDD